MEELHTLILNLYRAAQECAIDAFQERALDLLKDVVPFDSCRWGMALTFAGDRLLFERAHLHNEVDGIMDAYREAIDQDAIQEVEDAIAFAESSPEPPLDSLYENVFS